MKEIILKYIKSWDPELEVLGWKLLLENIDWEVVQNVIYPISVVQFKQELQDFYINDREDVDVVINLPMTFLEVFERTKGWPISDWLMNFLKDDA